MTLAVRDVQAGQHTASWIRHGASFPSGMSPSHVHAMPYNKCKARLLSTWACRTALRLTMADVTNMHMRREQCPHADVVVGPRLNLAEPESIAAFANSVVQSKRPLHVLVNNAGANYLNPWRTPQGVPGLCQVWHAYLKVPRPQMLQQQIEGDLVNRQIVKTTSWRYKWLCNMCD